MKKLLPYFMLFVIFSLILVQCAKMFPSDKRRPDYFPERAHELKNTVNKEKIKFTAQTDLTDIVHGFENKTIPFFKSIVIPRNITRNFDNTGTFNNPGVNFYYPQPAKTFKTSSHGPAIVDLSFLSTGEIRPW